MKARRNPLMRDAWRTRKGRGDRPATIGRWTSIDGYVMRGSLDERRALAFRDDGPFVFTPVNCLRQCPTCTVTLLEQATVICFGCAHQRAKGESLRAMIRWRSGTIANLP